MQIEEAAKKHNADPERAKAWDAWSNLFLDTEQDDKGHEYMARILAATPFSIDELKHIYSYEVSPACWGNLFQIAGEWAGFESEWLVKTCHKHQLLNPYSVAENRKGSAIRNLANVVLNDTAFDRNSVIAKVERIRGE